MYPDYNNCYEIKDPVERRRAFRRKDKANWRAKNREHVNMEARKANYRNNAILYVKKLFNEKL
jgi:hypothetical protein